MDLATAACRPANATPSQHSSSKAAEDSASGAPRSSVWTGDPATGTSVFARLNCAALGSITVARDAMHGRVWK